MMMEDYADAAERHFDDAKLLHTQVPSRLANASHLYGFAAECALKSMIRKTAPNAAFYGQKGHFPLLLTEFQNHSIANNNADLVRSVKQAAIGLDKWSINQRYNEQSTFVAQIVDAEAVSAQELLALSRDHLRRII
jgi:hypothetical protein